MDTEASLTDPNSWSSKTDSTSPTKKKNNIVLSYIKRMGKEFALSSLLIINGLTTLLVIVLILRLKLMEDHKLFEVGLDEDGAEILLVNGNLVADSLIPESGLIADKVLADRIEIGGDPGASIVLEDGSILMEADSYTIGKSASPISFKLPDRLESLHVPEGLTHVKYVRAPVARDNKPAPDLVVEPQEGALELSGNLGVRGHAGAEIILEAGKQVSLESKEESIEISAAPGGIRLSVNLPREDSYNVSHLRVLRQETRLPGLRQLVLVDRRDGRVYLD